MLPQMKRKLTIRNEMSSCFFRIVWSIVFLYHRSLIVGQYMSKPLDRFIRYSYDIVVKSLRIAFLVLTLIRSYRLYIEIKTLDLIVGFRTHMICVLFV